LIGLHGRTDDLHIALTVDCVGGHCAGVGCSAERFGHNEVTRAVERKPEWRHTGRRKSLRRAGHTAAVNGIGDEQVGAFLRNDKHAAVRTESYLRRTRTTAAERLTGDLGEFARAVQPEAGDIAAATGIEHVHDVAVGRHADRHLTARVHRVQQFQMRAARGQDGNVIAAGVANQQKPTSLCKNEAALITQTGACAVAARREAACGSQRTVAMAAEYEDFISVRGIGHGINHAVTA